MASQKVRPSGRSNLAETRTKTPRGHDAERYAATHTVPMPRKTVDNVVRQDRGHETQ